jgi:hypothetical protein
MLFIFLPSTLIFGSIKMAVNTLSMSFIIKPLSIIDISISMDESSFTIGFVIRPPSIVHGTIWPNLSSFALSYLLSDDPLSIVFGVVLKSDLCSLLNWFGTWIGLVLVVEVSELSQDVLDFGVVVILLSVIKLLVSHTSMSHSLSNLLSGDKASEVSLDLDDQSNLFHGVVVTGSWLERYHGGICILGFI